VPFFKGKSMSIKVISKQVLIECTEPFHYVFATTQRGLESGFYVKADTQDKAFKTGIPIEQFPKLNL
jgi:hypothetical protein